MSEIILKLKSSGYRITKERKSIISFLESAKKPISISEITSELKKKKVRFNQSTLYRLIKLLIEKRLLIKVNYNKETKYELVNTDKKSMHNLTCLSCGKNKKIKIDKNFSHFIIKSYGICVSCK